MVTYPAPDRDAITAVAAALGVKLVDDRVAALGAWLAELVRWNARIDLTAARSAGELLDLMLADALVLAGVARAGARVVDVGSGAGAPGLALAMARPDLDVTLVEPLQKRVAFLRTAIGASGATNARVLRGRGEDVATAGQTFDLAVARATLPPPEWLALGARLAGPGGEVAVLIAREPAPTLAGWSLAEERAYTWPRTGAERRLARYLRDAPT